MKRFVVALLVVALSQSFAAGQTTQTSQTDQSAQKNKKQIPKPQVLTPSTYRGDAATQPDPQSLANLKWFELFKDPKLQELINQASNTTTIYVKRSRASMRLEPILASCARISFPPSRPAPTLSTSGSLAAPRLTYRNQSSAIVHLEAFY